MLEYSWMQLKQKVTSIIRIIKKIPIWITVPAGLSFLVFLIVLVSFFIEKPVQFSYGDKTCARQLVLFPGVSKLSGNNADFGVINEDILKIGGIQLLSTKTCFVAKKAPVLGYVKLSIAPFGGFIAKKTFKLSIPQPPLVKADALAENISTTKTLSISLSGSDLIFDYKLEVENKSVDCPVEYSAIHCDVASLHLLQGKNYTFKLIRLFEGKKVSILVNKDIKTLESTNVIATSVSKGQTVYDHPRTFMFDFDKDVIDGSIILEKVESDKRIPVKTTLIINNKRATVTIADNLERDSIFEFKVEQIEAKDGSTLSEPYILNFKMSDGPSVTGVNVNKTGLALSQTIILTFDQNLSSTQNIANFVAMSGAPASISRLNNQIFIKYSNASMCADLNISVKPGLIGANGVIQNDSWNYSFRTVCHTTSVIGYSKEGRPIIAYIFGSGGTTILYTGSIHGNELSSKYLMDAWINELEVNSQSIPSDKKIVIVPSINPDGNVAVRRNNSNNVDLNRNFPAFDWQADVHTPSNQPLLGGGGSSPLSEPESQAIAAFTTKLSPRLTMSFHSSASYVIANQAGDSNTLAATYARLSGYNNVTGDVEAFKYPITGTYDDWMRDKYGLTSVLVELASSINPEFNRNKAALWAMAKS